MEHKKIIKFTVSIAVLMMIAMFVMLSGMVEYPFTIYMMAGVGTVILFLTVKFIYTAFTTDPVPVTTDCRDTPGQKLFFISSYRSTTFSVVMIVMPAFFIYFLLPSVPGIMKEIQTGKSAALIMMLVLLIILFLASLYSIFMGIKLFIRRKKIVQLIINDDSFEFFPIYDFGTGTRNFHAVSMFFRTKMEKAYFTDQLTVEIIIDKWLGNKIRVKVEGVGFYLPYLYNDTHELEEVYQTIKQRLQRKISGN
ncbi:hypothetical protein [Chryseobacterium herbae]|uniref:PH domain-containing protein n=1 Tax=Chryseobacterium herbae TaxID=2976476 RepID=A0ABT2IY85_9FLAO|nr:hypothetical protein [Chryseobacterium sp. pc1-10]MCT2563796.1 hypothetical protein [Chryseobacterium sp. pc1-10]